MPFPTQGKGTNDSLYSDCIAPEASVWLLLSNLASAHICCPFREAFFHPGLSLKQQFLFSPRGPFTRHLPEASGCTVESTATQPLNFSQLTGSRCPRGRRVRARFHLPLLTMYSTDRYLFNGRIDVRLAGTQGSWRMPLTLLNSSSKISCPVPKYFPLTMHYLFLQLTVCSQMPLLKACFCSDGVRGE